MSVMHKAVKEKLGNRRNQLILGGGLAVVLSLGFLATNFFQASFGYGYEPRFEECDYDDMGNIVGECNDDYGIVEQVNRAGSAYVDGETVEKNFWIKIEDIEVSGDDKAPLFWWLYKNNYRNEETREEIEQGDFPDDVHLVSGDLKWNTDIKNSLEAGTVCSMDVEVGANNQFEIETTAGDFEYANSPDYDERSSYDLFKNKVSVTANKVRVTKDRLLCRFDFTEIMNKGMTAPGQFVEWSGQPPEFDDKGGDYSFDIDFGMDSDFDGLNNENDECPQEAGLEKKDGCPNKPSTVETVSGPDNVTVKQNAVYTIQVNNPDGDPTNISWSNGETGQSATYSWNSVGSKTVSVTVNDGFDQRSQKIEVQVGEQTLFERIAELFKDLWQALTFQG